MASPKNPLAYIFQSHFGAVGAGILQVIVFMVGIGISMLSAGVAANVVSICSVAYYFIYVLTVSGAIYAYVKKKAPAPARP